MKITDYLAKPVVSIYEGEVVGTIKDVCFDKDFKRAKWLTLFSENEIVEDKVITPESVFSVGEHAVTIKYNALALPLQSYEGDALPNNPINKVVFTPFGRHLGKVVDVLLDEKHKVKEIILDDQTSVLAKEIFCQSKDIIMLKDKDVKVSKPVKKSPPMPSHSLHALKVKILDDENIALEEGITSQMESGVDNKPYQLDRVMPSKVAAGYTFLIGRKTGKHILDDQGSPIIRKGTTITQQTIVDAHRHNRLKELTAISFPA